MKKAPEQFRLREGILATNGSDGNNGCFIFKHPKIAGEQIRCIISDGEGWEHVSVSIARKATGRPTRNPTWEEMSFVKDQFWHPQETVLQFHPRESEHVNNHPFCLHLWRQIGKEIELPPAIMVGIKNMNLEKRF
jgi:hypothetical protein